MHCTTLESANRNRLSYLSAQLVYRLQCKLVLHGSALSRYNYPAGQPLRHQTNAVYRNGPRTHRADQITKSSRKAYPQAVQQQAAALCRQQSINPNHVQPVLTKVRWGRIAALQGWRYAQD